jgi:hypothetical protein
MTRFQLAVLVLAFFALTARAQTPADKQQADLEKDRYTAAGDLRKTSVYSGLPVIGEFQPQQQEPAADYTRRQIREQRYSASSLRRRIVDPGSPVGGLAESSHLRFINSVTIGPSPDSRGIPASVATAVVTGTILSGKCFLNSDQKFVYTDYLLKIDQVLKQDPMPNFKVGAQITVSRPGGAVRFPSGHVKNFLYPGQGFPAIGSQYILFLWKAIPNLPEYEILSDSGYELKSGRVYPLDDCNLEYEDMSSPVFLDLVHKAIAAIESEEVKP